MTTVERFMAKVKKTNSCWIWIGSQAGRGYGHFWYEGRLHGSHRISYKLFCGSIPNKRYVLHHCDNPPCVNPSHLFVGTQRDNLVDASNKGRMATGDRNGSRVKIENMLRGEKHGMSKLTIDEVREIRDRHDSGETDKSLAQIFNIGKSQIGRIVRLESWKR